MESNLFTALIQKLSKDFALESNQLPVQTDMEAIRQHLTERIREMMVRNYERFLNSMYRIDVSETKVSQILRSKDKLSIPGQLADLIIERQLQRIKTQMLYKEGKL
ncbi:MAG: hypothetical protein AB1521_09550 [Bacteroidota bacterium]